jgi:hypothetical protein
LAKSRSEERALREADFALRPITRSDGAAAIVYRRMADPAGRDRLQRVGAIAPLAYTAGLGLLREATGQQRGAGLGLADGQYHPVSRDWGARLACYAIVSAGLRDGERLRRTALHLRRADGDEAAWWLGLLLSDHENRALRALRILTEAVE